MTPDSPDQSETPDVTEEVGSSEPGAAPGKSRRTGRRRLFRRLLLTLLVLLIALGGAAYVARDKLVELAIRKQLTSGEPDPAYTADDGQVRVLLCGTGSPELSDAAQACTLVAAGGRMFLFDAGEGATRSLNSSNVELAEIDNVFLTHFHSDHFNGLGSLINQRWTWGATTPLEVAGPPGVNQVVKGINDTYQLDIGYRATDIEAQAEGVAAATAAATSYPIPEGQDSVRVYDEDGITIDAVRVAHDPVDPAYGYVLSYESKKVFISGDTMVVPENLPAMQDADLVVHEAYSTHLVEKAIPVMRDLGQDFDADVAERTGHYHADTIALAEQAQEAGVKHLVLTHLIPYPSSFVQRRMFVSGMSEEYDGEITVGQDGTLIVL